ncbi:MAG: TIGR04219 family outer membrane beta-barrel protein [Arcobacteraceae bacterium]
MKKIILSSIVAISLATSIHADFIGAEAGYAIWNSSLSGDIQKGNGTLDFENDLGYGSSETNSFMWAYIDHPLPLLPNFKIQKTNYSDDASGRLNKNVTFDNQNFTMNENVSSSITLDQVDFIPYWRILDNWVNLDIGLNIKMIDGNIKVSSKDAVKPTDSDFNVILPMLYTKARFDLPLTGLSLEADASYVSYDGNKFSDLKAGIVYETTIGLGATVGYRQQKITLDDIDDVYGDLTIKGAYAGIFYHF